MLAVHLTQRPKRSYLEEREFTLDYSFGGSQSNTGQPISLVSDEDGGLQNVYRASHGEPESRGKPG